MTEHIPDIAKETRSPYTIDHDNSCCFVLGITFCNTLHRGNVYIYVHPSAAFLPAHIYNLSALARLEESSQHAQIFPPTYPPHLPSHHTPHTYSTYRSHYLPPTPPLLLLPSPTTTIAPQTHYTLYHMNYLPHISQSPAYLHTPDPPTCHISYTTFHPTPHPLQYSTPSSATHHHTTPPPPHTFLPATSSPHPSPHPVPSTPHSGISLFPNFQTTETSFYMATTI